MTPTPSSTTQNTGPAAEETDTQFAQKFEPPPGFVTTAVPAVDVLVPDAFSRWDPGQQRGYLAQRAINAAEGGTVLYTYACVRRATEHNQQPDPLDTAATMVGASMALSRRDAFRLVTTAVELIERLPRTSALLTTGWIGIQAAHAIADETALVEDHLIPELDRRISEGLAPTRRRTHPPKIGPLRKMLSKLVTACDPVAADARTHKTTRDQNVRTTPLPGDHARITATLAAVDALEIADRIEALVRTASTDDSRTTGQLRAAGLLALSRGWTCLPEPDGSHPTDPAAQDAVRRVVIHSYDDGDPDFRGLFLPGYGPVSGHTADELQRTGRRRLDALDTFADPDSDAAHRYTPSQALTHFCHGRDGTCVFPGCQTPADKTDLDHIIPFNHHHPDRGGLTTSDDLASLCRTHHRLKTEGIWAYYRNTEGDYIWIHGPHHPDHNPGTHITSTPNGPLAHFAAPRHPHRSRLQQEAAETGHTGNGLARSQRRPHQRQRRHTKKRHLRAQAEQRLQKRGVS